VARSRLFDVLQDSYFWAFDTSREAAIPVFTPLFGFSRISSPSISADVETFKDGTYLYPRHVIKGAEVGSVTFERAATMFDADFYDWMTFAIHGNKDFESGGTLGKISNALSAASPSTYRRTIVIVQFNRINLGKMSDNDPLVRVGLGVGGALVGGLLGNIVGGESGTVGVGTVSGAAFGAMAAAGLGPFQFASRLPGRAWVLHDCIPINYRAASDFDASSGQVSFQEIEVQPEYVEELSLGLKP
jgi:phage tail-like protein